MLAMKFAMPPVSLAFDIAEQFDQRIEDIFFDTLVCVAI